MSLAVLLCDSRFPEGGPVFFESARGGGGGPPGGDGEVCSPEYSGGVFELGDGGDCERGEARGQG